MKTQIIKNYTNWLNENLLIAEAEGVDIGALYKAGNLAGLVEAAMSADSPEIKAHPAYTSVMQWWKNGGGDLNLVKTLLKKSSASKSDKTNSLKSMYYWTGGTVVNAKSPTTDTFYKVADAIIANGAKAGVTAEKISQLKQAIDKLKQAKRKGFDLANIGLLGSIVPEALVNGTAYGVDIVKELTKPSDQIKDSLKAALVKWQLSATTPSPELKKDPLTSANFLVSQQTNAATVNSYWTSAVPLTDADKKAILDYFKSKADAYVSSKKDSNITFDKAILIATNLRIAPKGQAITVDSPESTDAASAPIIQTFSYPADAKGDPNSLAAKSSQNLFPDDGVIIAPVNKAELDAMVKSAIDAVKTAGGTITAISTWGLARTSKVGTSYGSKDKTFSPTNNIPLANDRLSAINKALADSISANGITITPTVDMANNKAIPNAPGCPDWTDADKRDPKWGPIGDRSPLYQSTYGPWRFAQGFLQLTYTITNPKPKIPEASATPNNEWKSVISWSDESWQPELKVKFGTSWLGKLTVAPGESGGLDICPKMNQR
jgi:hypothetical protein